MSVSVLIILLMIGLLVYGLYRNKKSAQLAYIESYRFNSAIANKVKARYPHLSDEQTKLVLDGLREYFYICSQAKR